MCIIWDKITLSLLLDEILLYLKIKVALCKWVEDTTVEIYNHDLFVLLFAIFTRFPAFADVEGLAGETGLYALPVLPSLPLTRA